MPKQTGTNGESYPLLRSIRSQPAVARVLVVGEENYARRWACWRLRKAGFTVRTTDSGIDALILARGDPPDLIVVGDVVGWLDVRYLLALLRRDARTATTPILLITPRASGTLARDCHRLGATLVVKPGGRSLSASTTASAKLRERARQS